MTWLITKEGEWVNPSHVREVRLGAKGYYAKFADGDTVSLDGATAESLTQEVIPAHPGYAMYFWDVSRLTEMGEPVIAWLVDMFCQGETPIPIGDFSGVVIGQHYAVRRPDGTWAVPEAGEYKDRAGAEAAVARQAKAKLTA